MVSLTDRVALRKPAGSDPFLRSDFEYNWDRIDDYPGVFPCTAASHPTWGTDQAGLLIHETDTGKILRWTGTVFVTPNIFPKAAIFSTSPGVTIAPSTTYTQAMGSFTPPRSCHALVTGSIFLGRSGPNSQAAGCTIYVDGVDITQGGTSMVYIPAITSGDPTISLRLPVFGYVTNLTAASHALSARVDVGSAAASVGWGTVNLAVLYLDN